MISRFIFLLLVLGFSLGATADVVKPALVEISASTDGHCRIEIRASVEALLTGINSRYKNTQDSPNAGAYDAFRVLPPAELMRAFDPFQDDFLQQVALVVDGEKVGLKIQSIDIPEPGYTKVPRTSVITLSAALARQSESLTWYYPAKFGDNAVRVRQVDERNERWHWSEWQWLRHDEPSEPFSLTEVFTRRPWYRVVSSYALAGFEHIVPKGLDHILFIIGIFLLCTTFKPLLLQVTMFTVAHSITLGLAMYGLVALPASIVEPLIALSIAYIGIENILSKTLHSSRLLLVFAFGLLHGLGFASVLSEFGMPNDAFGIALIGFNIGVELGQLAVILAGFLLVGFWFRHRADYRMFVVIPGSVLISLIGLYWTWDRIVI